MASIGNASEEIEFLLRELPRELEGFLGNGRQLEVLGPLKATADATRKFLIRDAEGNPSEVVICSAPDQSDLVTRGMERAKQAYRVLGEQLGKAILLPLAEGRVGTQKYALLPYCTPLYESGPKWWVQRALIRPQVFRWLLEATRMTVRPVRQEELDSHILAPLESFCGETDAPVVMRRVAENALNAAQTGRWVPQHVLMHDDFWEGNLLIDQRSAGGARFGQFVIIDWPGSRVEGYPLYDFLRMAYSIRLKGRAFSKALDAQCGALGCGRDEAPHHFIAAAAELRQRLENWPLESYRTTVQSCLDLLM